MLGICHQRRFVRAHFGAVAARVPFAVFFETGYELGQLPSLKIVQAIGELHHDAPCQLLVRLFRGQVRHLFYGRRKKGARVAFGATLSVYHGGVRFPRRSVEHVKFGSGRRRRGRFHIG